jgi:3-deoxy-D-manno-octulosonate 8-phosphate phosphatase (KDO 8-P phosphatase)
VDGVLTDGQIVLTPNGEEIKAFHVRDGAGLKLWQATGRAVAIITGRSGPAVSRRAQELGIERVRLGSLDKLADLNLAMDELGVTPAQVAAMGDDLADLPMLRAAALAMAPSDAVQEVREEADYVTRAPGGGGAVREAVEWLLKACDEWAPLLRKVQGEGRE